MSDRSEQADLGPGDVVTVGDLSSDEVGSGARMGADKPAVELIPVRCWYALFARQAIPIAYADDLMGCVESLSEFQEQRANGNELLASIPDKWFIPAAHVFAYGKNKYAAWNWLKGMPWSVPMGCAIRHARAIIIDRELDDEESGLSHVGHFVCNLIMLATYYETFPQGNDLPDGRYFNG